MKIICAVCGSVLLHEKVYALGLCKEILVKPCRKCYPETVVEEDKVIKCVDHTCRTNSKKVSDDFCIDCRRAMREKKIPL